jgi:hypothetical protein
MHLHPRDSVDYQGVAYRVKGILDYRLHGRVLRLACLAGDNETRYLELPGSEMADRLLILSEIGTLDITTPPPATIYHGGESFLLRFSGAASVTITGGVPDRQPGTCNFWRYRAAGDRYLHIEAWPRGVVTLEGASVHRSMIEIRPATSQTP